MIDRSKRWTQADDDLIRAHYPDGDTLDVARMLGRSPRALLKRAGQIGVYKTPDFLAAMSQRRAKTLAGRAAEQLEREREGPRIEVRPGDKPGIIRVVRHRAL